MSITKIVSDVITADAITGAKIVDDAINSEHYAAALKNIINVNNRNRFSTGSNLHVKAVQELSAEINHLKEILNT